MVPRPDTYTLTVRSTSPALVHTTTTVTLVVN
jgi:hypothetical protein